MFTLNEGTTTTRKSLATLRTERQGKVLDDVGRSADLFAVCVMLWEQIPPCLSQFKWGRIGEHSPHIQYILWLLLHTCLNLKNKAIFSNLNNTFLPL